MTPTEALARALLMNKPINIGSGEWAKDEAHDIIAALAALGYEVRPIEQAAEAADREAAGEPLIGHSPAQSADISAAADLWQRFREHLAAEADRLGYSHTEPYDGPGNAAQVRCIPATIAEQIAEKYWPSAAACGARSPDGRWRCSFLPPHGPRHSWEEGRVTQKGLLVRRRDGHRRFFRWHIAAGPSTTGGYHDTRCGQQIKWGDIIQWHDDRQVSCRACLAALP